MSGPNRQLLSDLARLAAKYEPKDWTQLVAWLEDERRRGELRALLLELAATSHARRKARPRRVQEPSRASRVRAALAEVRVEDAARADLLEDVWLKLRERDLLPTIGAVRVFAEAMGLKGLKSKRRDQAITELMERLVELPGDALEQRMRQTVVEERKLGEEYEQWVRLILGRPSEGSEAPAGR